MDLLKLIKNSHKDNILDLKSCIVNGDASELGIYAKHYKEVYEQIMNCEFSPSENIAWSAGAYFTTKRLLEKIEDEQKNKAL